MPKRYVKRYVKLMAIGNKIQQILEEFREIQKRMYIKNFRQEKRFFFPKHFINFIQTLFFVIIIVEDYKNEVFTKKPFPLDLSQIWHLDKTIKSSHIWSPRLDNSKEN